MKQQGMALLWVFLFTGCALGAGNDVDGGNTGESFDAFSSPDALPGQHPDGGGGGSECQGDHFPCEFPPLIDSGGSGAGQAILGFGGDITVDRAGNRAAVRRRPVILLHGNGCHTEHENFGMLHVRDKLLAAGYSPAEIWAPSYLGQDITSAEMPTPHRANIDDVRSFIDAVLDYLAVDHVDVVSHSLGCGMINGYLRGMKVDGTFDHDDQRFDRVATVICMGGALYGTGYGMLYEPEFNVLGAFTGASLEWQGVEDATPYGATSTEEMTSPDQGLIPGSRPFRAVSAADDGSMRIHYVGLWAIGDLVDGNLTNAGGLQGADLNQGFVLPDTMEGVLTAQLARHMHLLHDQGVFDTFLTYLNL